MKKYKVKTAWSIVNNQDDMDCFDETLEKYLNDGYELIGNIRTVSIGDADFGEGHFATLRKVIYDHNSPCVICGKKVFCPLYKSSVEGGTPEAVTSCPYFAEEGEDNE